MHLFVGMIVDSVCRYGDCYFLKILFSYFFNFFLMIIEKFCRICFGVQTNEVVWLLRYCLGQRSNENRFD